MKISEFFLSENDQFLEVNFSIYLNRRVFVMGHVHPAKILSLIGNFTRCILDSR